MEGGRFARPVSLGSNLSTASHTPMGLQTDPAAADPEL